MIPCSYHCSRHIHVELLALVTDDDLAGPLVPGLLAPVTVATTAAGAGHRGEVVQQHVLIQRRLCHTATPL